MSLHCEIRPATRDDIATIADLADRIWRTHYPGIIPAEQIDYMLAQRYSHAALLAQIEAADQWFDLALIDGKPAGFAQYYRSAPDEIKLDKLYLLPELHGKGYGSRLIYHVKKQARQLGGKTLILSVNKHNKKAISAYQHSGFVIRDSVMIDIGGGFVMDDYVMAKTL
ncbi:N-acetyltransferase [Chitinimonas arctica]|uniref:N-acetyltransferase n=1 Tax=Chitinimonas arctica TaxID=2594795 RepID=A0A516SI88_9NEIS|nr:GNAT family N-acetyltransferase [Chitinimonas arctica]QDQ27856.1 N-acetyltransferase [Chitinimonas arctica]